MIRYFTNRQLASSLDINLARWKRWSREFLPPDPLGGLQSGVARDYSIDDALTVFLGGCLVSGLNFTLPQARRILSDLEPWLTGAGVYINRTLQKCYRSDIHLQVREYQIYIYPVITQSTDQPVFRYLIRGILQQPSNQDDHTLKMQQYIEIALPVEGPETGEQDNIYLKILNITSALRRFITRLKLDEKTFPIFNFNR